MTTNLTTRRFKTRTHIFGAVLAAGLSAGLLTLAGQGSANAAPLLPLAQTQTGQQGAVPFERTQFRVVVGDRHHWRGRRDRWRHRHHWRRHCYTVWRHHRRIRVCR